MGEEAKIEKRCKDLVEASGCAFWKLTSPGRRGVPDRLILISADASRTRHPITLFVEFKAPGKKPTVQQQYNLDKLHSMGFLADWFDDYDEFRSFWGKLVA
jgi:hypothetical protein